MRRVAGMSASRVLAFVVAALLLCAAAETTLFTEEFQHGLSDWVVELEKPGIVEARSGTLEIDVPAGCTVWYKQKLTSPVTIQYEAEVVQHGGPHDRVSDLNCFWMATDTRSPADFFAKARSGKFPDYNQLRTYYVGQGGNTNSTTRFRRYIGEQDNRPLLPQHDLRDASVLLKPNVVQNIRITVSDGRTQYSNNGRTIFDFQDPEPYSSGYFGFRTTQSHLRIRHFRVSR